MQCNKSLGFLFLILSCYFTLVQEVHAEEVVHNHPPQDDGQKQNMHPLIVTAAFLLLTGYVLAKIYFSNLDDVLQKSVALYDSTVSQASINIYIKNLDLQVNTLFALEQGSNLAFQIIPPIAMKVILQAINENTYNTLSWLPLPLTNPQINMHTFATLVKTLVTLEDITSDSALQNKYFLYTLDHVTIIYFLVSKLFCRNFNGKLYCCCTLPSDIH